MARRQQYHHRHGKVVALSVPPFFRLLCLFLTIIAFPIWILQGSRLHTEDRLAIIIPFVGQGPEHIPSYLNLFCIAAAGSASKVDFLLIHNGVLDSQESSCTADNVKFLSMGSIGAFTKQLTRVLDQVPTEELAIGSLDRVARILSNYLFKYPYVLVEFKPALGHVFSEFLEGYSHWGYSDLDIVFGDLPRWITEDEWKDFDVVTYGYGDQHRVYLRGQFTFHKNNQKTKQLWRQCKFLSRMDQRFADVMEGKKNIRFESAEGCYSKAILEQNDIAVKYAAKGTVDVATFIFSFILTNPQQPNHYAALTDTLRTDTAYSHGMFIGFGSKLDKTVLYKAGSKLDGKALSRLPSSWFENKGSIYRTKEPLMKEVGERERLPNVEKEKGDCMFWVMEKYQKRLCLDEDMVSSTQTIYWINGQLYKQNSERTALPGKIESAPFFHFQEWKRYYRSNQLAGFNRNGPVRTFVLTKEGVLPMYSKDLVARKGTIPSPLGLKPRKWNGIRDNDRSQLPRRLYCLKAGPRKFPPKPPAPECHESISWADEDAIQILNGAPEWTQVNMDRDVTLVLTLQIQAEQAADPHVVQGLLEIIQMYLNRWQGQPCVLMIHVAGASPELLSGLTLKLGPGSKLSYYGLENCFVGAIFSKTKHTISRKALMNMATDIAPTRWVMSGFELERGLTISHDAAFFAHRVSQIQKDNPGSVFVIPQFALAHEESDFTLPSLLKLKRAGNLQSLSTLDNTQCEDDQKATTTENLFDGVHDLWWESTERFVTDKRTPDIKNDKDYEAQARKLDDIQLGLMRLMTEKQHYSLYSMDLSPILLIDNLGPRTGIRTSDFVREVDELGGKQCYNGMRLAQLATLGYIVDILAGAFALSTPATRSQAFAGTIADSAQGSSRCDGCFFFDEEHEDILEDIVFDERKRPAKAALLWEDSVDPGSLARHS